MVPACPVFYCRLGRVLPSGHALGVEGRKGDRDRVTGESLGRGILTNVRVDDCLGPPQTIRMCKSNTLLPHLPPSFLAVRGTKPMYMKGIVRREDKVRETCPVLAQE